MHITLESQILGNRQRHLRRDQPLYYRIIGQVKEHADVVRHAAFLESLLEELGDIMFYAHRSEYHRELSFCIISQRCLLYYLRGKLVMRKAISREYWQFLTTDQCRQPINRRYTRTDIVPRIFPANRIQGQPVYIPPVHRGNRPQSVNRLPDSVKRTPQHIRRYRNFHRMAGQFRMGIGKRHILRPFKYLYNSLVFVQFYDTAHLSRAAFYHKLYNLVEKGILYSFQDNERAVNIA